ncbi:MAG TPA: flagellar basal body rod protein FlgB [Opitutaceae bacterium]
MIDHLLASENYGVAKKLLDAAALRHEALATNIANVETAGFKRVDLAPDFARQLADFSARPGMDTIEAIHPKVAEDRLTQAMRPDGNNVQVDRELLEMNRNALEYEFLTQYASDSIKRLKSAITGRIQ